MQEEFWLVLGSEFQWEFWGQEVEGGYLLVSQERMGLCSPFYQSAQT